MLVEGIAERLSARRRSKEQLLERERSLYGAVKKIEVFPGTLEEFERLKGQPYRIIDIPGSRKLVEGDTEVLEQLPWQYWREDHPRQKWGNAHSLLTGNTPYRMTISRMLIQASELGADAVIRYQILNDDYETGIPVKATEVSQENLRIA